MSSNGHKKELYFTQVPQRVVSLVPSLTESLFELGFGKSVAAITDYCVHPAEALKHLPRIGGPRTPRLADILALQPDLVIADQDENTREAVEALEAENVPVWVTQPCTVREAMDILWKMVELFRDPKASARLQTLEVTLNWLADAEQSSFSYFCPLWQEADESPWWITFNEFTYMHDLLRLMGGRNVFAQRRRRYPLEADLGRAEAQPVAGRDTRYPRVPLAEVCAAQPEVILLPDEPFAFDAQQQAQLASWLAETPAVRNGRLIHFDGSLITWHGTRLARALRDLPQLLAVS